MEGFKTNISLHICIITGVNGVELRKPNFHLKFLRIWVWIRQRQFGVLLCHSRTLKGASGNAVDVSQKC